MIFNYPTIGPDEIAEALFTDLSESEKLLLSLLIKYHGDKYNVASKKIDELNGKIKSLELELLFANQKDQE